MGTAGNLARTEPIMNVSTGFIELYEGHYAAVYRTALRVTGNPADAEDVLQTVFMRILAQGVRLDSEPMPEAYFRRAATNAAIDVLRRKTVHAETPLDGARLHAVPEPQTLLKERLRRALAALDQEDAALFLLRFVEGMSNGELAELFNQEKNNIAVRLHRIRQALQVEMER